MKPIIDPMFFYWADTLDKLSFALGVVSAISLLVIFGVSFGCFVMKTTDGEEFTEVVKQARVLTFPFFSALFLGLISILIPQKEVMYQMAVARAVTPDNIKLLKGEVKDSVVFAKDSAKELIDYVILKTSEKKK